VVSEDFPQFHFSQVDPPGVGRQLESKRRVVHFHAAKISKRWTGWDGTGWDGMGQDLQDYQDEQDCSD